MLRRSIVQGSNNYCVETIMSTTAILSQHTAANFGPLLRALPGLAGLAALLVLFRPLLAGLLRAALLLVRPRLSRDELKARAQMRDRQVLERMIASSNGPSLTAELRAMAARD